MSLFLVTLFQKVTDLKNTYLSTHTVYWYKIQLFSLWIQENIIFMRFCFCFKLSKKIEKLSNMQLTHTIAKCTLTGLVQ